MILETLPPEAKEFYKQIYAGVIFNITMSEIVSEFRRIIHPHIHESFAKNQCPLIAENENDPKKYFDCLQEARHSLKQDASRWQVLQALVQKLPLGKMPLALDEMRLRINQPFSSSIAEAQPAFGLHRDTWYANPSHQINIWFCLHDCVRENSLRHYPRYFDFLVKNNSDHFDYETWKTATGWQSAGNEGTHAYPTALEKLDGEGSITWELPVGQILIFSAAHIHQGIPNATRFPRISVDMRIVPLTLDFGVAPAVDNRSRGSTLLDYYCMEHHMLVGQCSHRVQAESI